MTGLVGKPIGEMMGECIKMDTNARGIANGWNLWIQVLIDIKKPLSRGVHLQLRQNLDIWFLISYEFCYVCSLLRHFMGDCEDLIEGKIK